MAPWTRQQTGNPPTPKSCGTVDSTNARRLRAILKDGYSPCLVHGDDFLAVGTRSELSVIEALLTGNYECKVQYTGLEEGMERSVRILGQHVTYTDDGLSYEADPVHAEISIQALGLDGARSVATPCSAESASGETGGAVRARRLLEDEVCRADGVEDPELDDERRVIYVSITARLNYLSQDRPDIQYAVKELTRRSSSPSESDWVRLKRVGRYLIDNRRLVLRFPWAPLCKEVQVFADANFAGCARTRKSTSGGAARWGQAALKTWSKTQATIALSTGESELAAVVRAATEGLGLKSVLSDFGYLVTVIIHSDATAAIGMVQRRGLGKVRHLAVADLWIQQKIGLKEIYIQKVWTKFNPADMLTKGLDRESILGHLVRLGFAWRTGRHPLAPTRT